MNIEQILANGGCSSRNHGRQQQIYLQQRGWRDDILNVLEVVHTAYGSYMGLVQIFTGKLNGLR